MRLSTYGSACKLEREVQAAREAADRARQSEQHAWKLAAWGGRVALRRRPRTDRLTVTAKKRRIDEQEQKD